MDKTDISILILTAYCLAQTGWLVWLSQRCLRLERERIRRTTAWHETWPWADPLIRGRGSLGLD